jgi:hypothetical protein
VKEYFILTALFEGTFYTSGLIVKEHLKYAQENFKDVIQAGELYQILAIERAGWIWNMWH